LRIYFFAGSISHRHYQYSGFVYCIEDFSETFFDLFVCLILLLSASCFVGLIVVPWHQAVFCTI